MTLNLYFFIEKKKRETEIYGQKLNFTLKIYLWPKLRRVSSLLIQNLPFLHPLIVWLYKPFEEVLTCKLIMISLSLKLCNWNQSVTFQHFYICMFRIIYKKATLESSRLIDIIIYIWNEIVISCSDILWIVKSKQFFLLQTLTRRKWFILHV